MERKYSAGETAVLPCSGCQSEQSHTVNTASKQGKITNATCDTCGSVSTFTRGVKTGNKVGNAKAASAYDRNHKYKKGDSMTHSHFGHGEVTAVESSKMDVLFGDKTRRLLHDQ
jgi:uncharacterized Zn finger protein